MKRQHKGERFLDIDPEELGKKKDDQSLDIAKFMSSVDKNLTE